jgi:muramoyltetrapeptide carboxypeptidase
MKNPMPDGQIPRVKPPALRPGDTVGIIAPASNLKLDWLEAGCHALRDLGYNPVYSDSILSQDLYFAGTLERRIRELEDMFTRDDVRAVLCARGGYGCNYLLNQLSLDKIRAHPKIFAGYSDITSLLTWFTDAIGLVTFHGPMVTKDFSQPDGIDLPSWQAALTGLAGWDLCAGAASGIRPLVEGEAGGVLYGGCLSMLSASLGTPYEIQTAGTILFIEDVATRPYQVDRMLMQLKLAGKFDGVQGILFGEMLDCQQTQNQGYTLDEVILRVIGGLGVPVASGLRSGHVSRGNVTLPLGVRASFSVTSRDVNLRIEEAATAPAAVWSSTRV